MITGRYKYLFLSTVAALVVIVDQVVKRWVVHHFHGLEGPFSKNAVIPGLFDLILTRNPGAAWGMLGNLRPDGLRVAVFICISVGAVGMVLWIAKKAKPYQSLLVIALSLVLGGALGNLVDRIVAGRVVDFLDFYTSAPWFMKLSAAVGQRCEGACHWPAFNVADMCISTGVILLVLETFVSGRKEKAAAPPEVSPPMPAAGPPLTNGAAPPEPPQAPPSPVEEGGGSTH